VRTDSSNFVTKGGLIFLSVLVLISAYYGLSDLTLFTGLVLVLALVSFLWVRFSLTRIDVDVSDCCLYAFPGEILNLKPTILNNKALMLIWLDFVLPFCTYPCISKDIEEHLTWILPWQKISWNISVTAEKRGVAQIESITLRSGDGFGLGEKEKTVMLKNSLKIVVYPRVHPIDPSPLLSNLSELEQSKNGLYKDRTLINNIREYTPGDSVKSINWRMMAKNDHIMVNINENMSMRRVCFIIDLKTYSYYVKKDSSGEEQFEVRVHSDELERDISIVASYISALNDKNILCTLALPAPEDKECRIIIPKSCDEQVVMLFNALAEIDYRGENIVIKNADIEDDRHLLGQLYKIDYVNGLMKQKGVLYEKI